MYSLIYLSIYLFPLCAQLLVIKRLNIWHKEAMTSEWLNLTAFLGTADRGPYSPYKPCNQGYDEPINNNEWIINWL